MMNKYIKADWLESEFNEANEISFFYLNANSYEAFEELKRIIEQAPSIDLVTCKECKHSYGKPIADGRYWCDMHGSFLHYCSEGETK